MNVEYVNFDLFIEHSEEGYWTRVLDSPYGQTLAPFTLPFAKRQLDQFNALIAEPMANDPQRIAPKVQAIQEFGSKLFDSVFHKDVYSTYASSLNLAFQDRKRLRLRLRMSELPDLVRLPWEYLYDTRRQEFLALSIQTPIVRYVDLMHRVLPLAVDLPLRVLVVISSPDGWPTLNVENEWLTLIDSVDFLGKERRMVFEELHHPTLLDLQRKLRQGEYHILHFIGHSEFDTQAQDGVLIFEDEQGRPRPVTGQHFGRMLRDHYPMRLLVLHACKGARGGVLNPYAGVAQSVVLRGMSAVVAMQYEVTTNASQTFAREFYAAIADGHAVDVAMVNVRKAMLAAEAGVEWGTPVLFMRTNDGQLFEQKTSEIPSTRPLSTTPGRRYPISNHR